MQQKESTEKTSSFLLDSLEYKSFIFINPENFSVERRKKWYTILFLCLFQWYAAMKASENKLIEINDIGLFRVHL